MSDLLIDPLHECGIVPFIRTRSAERANCAVEWLSDAGFRTFELAASICGIVELVEDLSGNVEFDVGVGMVMDRERARACIEAVASYIVTPGIVADVVEPCREAGVACVLDASTPSEVMRAHGLGADAVKVFPVGSLGGERARPGRTRENAAAQQEALRDVPTPGTQGFGPRVSPFLRRRPIARGGGRIRAGPGFREA